MKYIVFCMLLLISQWGVSQSNLLTVFSDSKTLGDKYFEKYAFVDALDSYKRALAKNEDDDHVKLKIAECYRMLNDPVSSSEWYGKVLQKNTDVGPDYMLKYADALAGSKRYEEAKEWYEKYKKEGGGKAVADEKVKAIDAREDLHRNSGLVSIEKAGFNSEYSDFSPAYFENGLIFLSARPEEKSGSAAYNWDKSNYLDAYLADRNGSVTPFSSQVNGKYHEGPMAFYDNYNKLIFTKDNYEKGKLSKSQKGVTKLKLYYAERNKATGEWSDPSPLSFNSDEHSVGHPAITQDGKTLYFVSDMPGGFGGTDLYRTEYKDDKWQAPVNLGEHINTSGNEMFPFLHDDEQLFFASTGHGGLGGLDLFVIDLSKGTDSKIHNVGAPVNSNFDDFGLILSEKGDEGYFSSNRDGGTNRDDIYAFKTGRSFVRDYLVKGRVMNNFGNDIIAEAVVVLEDKNGNTVSSTSSGSNGEFSFEIDPGKEYVLKARKEGFHENKLSFTTQNNDKEEWVFDLHLMSNYAFVLVGEVLEKGTQNPVTEVNVNVIDNFTGKEVLKENTDEEGTFNYFIKNRKIHERISYHIHLEKKGYLSKSFVLNDSLSKPGKIYLKEYFDLSLDKVDIGMDLGRLADVEPIYFDLGKAVIRKDAARELDKIVELMKENPTLEIELGSHTDARGSAASNMTLSDKRAKASAEYIASRGIESSRITGKGYGESETINECADGIKCTEEQHQENRRTEFKVVKF